MDNDKAGLISANRSTSSGLIRAGLLGALVLLAVFGLVSIIGNTLGFTRNNMAAVKAPVTAEFASENQFKVLSSEWLSARNSLQKSIDREKKANSLVGELSAKTITQETILRNAERTFTQSIDAVSKSEQSAEEIDVELKLLSDDSLEQRVARASKTFEAVKLQRQTAEADSINANAEVDRIENAVEKLLEATAAATYAAKASAELASIADSAQIALDENTDIFSEKDGITLQVLREDFFNEAKSQADASTRAASAASRAATAGEKKLKQAQAQADTKLLTGADAVENEKRAKQDLAALAKQLEMLQFKRVKARNKSAISLERIAAGKMRLEKRRTILQTETLKLEDLKNDRQELLSKRNDAQTVIKDAQEIYNTAEMKLRDAQKLRAKIMASKIAELNSVMHDKLRKTLGNLRIENPEHDRFIVPSEALFESGSAKVGAAGQTLITDIAEVVKEVTQSLPSDVNWMLRVDGHTDNAPINGGSFKDNWGLSQARAVAVVRHLVNEGNIAPNRLAANGLGEYQPLKSGDSEQVRAENRRIELALVPR
ncbi:MAG: hypothetical protein COB84_01600 [Rhodobacteraceae bacterium]|nr:MAG: hypothetical protein COB84_01600 [Paracoccaceae bacterium]